MFKEILEGLVDLLALILLISCVLGEAWKSCLDSVNWGLIEIYLYLPGWGKGSILLVILLCKFKNPPVPL